MADIFIPNPQVTHDAPLTGMTNVEEEVHNKALKLLQTAGGIRNSLRETQGTCPHRTKFVSRNALQGRFECKVCGKTFINRPPERE